MSRQGRKRKSNVTRQPDGSIKSYEDPSLLARQRRIQHQLWRDSSHEWHGYPLGIMFGMRLITIEEFNAGKKWAALTWRVAQRDGLMLPMCRSIDWMGPQGRALQRSLNGDELKTLRQEKERLATLNARIATVHAKAIGIMRRLCIADEEIGHTEQTIAKAAMAIIATKQDARH